MRNRVEWGTIMANASSLRLLFFAGSGLSLWALSILACVQASFGSGILERILVIYFFGILGAPVFLWYLMILWKTEFHL